MSLGSTITSVLLVVCLAGGMSPRLANAVEVGDPAPGFSAASLTGDPVSLEALRDKVVLVNFWASWCEPCRDELPALREIRERYNDKGFEIVGVSVDQQEDNARAFLERYAVNYPVVMDTDFRLAAQYQARGMPSSYLIDRAGTLRSVFVGFSQKKLPQIEDAVANLVANGE